MNNFKKHCFKTILKLSILGFISFNHFLHANSYDFGTTRNYIFGGIKPKNDNYITDQMINIQLRIIDALIDKNSECKNKEKFKTYMNKVLSSTENIDSFENLFFDYKNDIYPNSEKLDPKTKTYRIPFTHEKDSINKEVTVIFGEEWYQEYGFALKVTMAVVYNLETVYKEKLSSDDICKIYDGIVEKLDIFAKGMGYMNNERSTPKFGNLYIYPGIENADSIVNKINEKTRSIGKTLSKFNILKGSHKGQDVNVLIKNNNIKLTISIASNKSFDVNIKISRTKTDQNTTGIILNRMYLGNNLTEEDINNFGTRIKEIIPSEVAYCKPEETILDVVNTYLHKLDKFAGNIIRSYCITNEESPDEVKNPQIILIKPRYVDFSTLLDTALGDATIDYHIANKRNIFLHFATPIIEGNKFTSCIVAYSVIKNFGNLKKVDQYIKRNIKPVADIETFIDKKFRHDKYVHDQKIKKMQDQDDIFKTLPNNFSYDLGYAENPYSYENTLYISKISKDKCIKTLGKLRSMYKADNKDKAQKIFDNYFFFQIK